MSHIFNPQTGLIIVQAHVWGPTGDGNLRLALDTGAQRSVLSVAVLIGIGLDPALSPKRIQVTTASGIEFAPLVTLSKMRALDQERISFPAIALTLPHDVGVDGLLGLDFLRGSTLTIDFKLGSLRLS